MPNMQSAEKRVRQNRKRRQRNKTVKTRVKMALQDVRDAIESEEDESTVRERERTAISLLDKAGGKGVFHENKVARLKSRLQRTVNEYVDEGAS